MKKNGKQRLIALSVGIVCAVLILFGKPCSVEAAAASNLRTLMDSQTLVPTTTGNLYCDLMVQQIISEITTPNMDTYDKVKACYDYLINESCYYGYGKPAVYPGGDNVRAVADAAGGYTVSLDYARAYFGSTFAADFLYSRTGVCDDYACAFAAMCRQIGLNCWCISGKTQKAGGGYTGHTWNEMLLGGQFYYFDADIDDNIANGGKTKSAGRGAIKYYYFGKTYESNPKAYQRQEFLYTCFLPYTAFTQPNSTTSYPDSVLEIAYALCENAGTQDYGSVYNNVVGCEAAYDTKTGYYAAQ